MKELQARLKPIAGAGAIAVQSLAQLRQHRTVGKSTPGSEAMPDESFRLVRGPHPSGHQTTLPLATWIRPCVTKVSTLEPAPLPGTHTIPVLREHGFTDNEIATLVDESVAFTGWKLLKHYLPS